MPPVFQCYPRAFGLRQHWTTLGHNFLVLSSAPVSICTHAVISFICLSLQTCNHFSIVQMFSLLVNTTSNDYTFHIPTPHTTVAMFYFWWRCCRDGIKYTDDVRLPRSSYDGITVTQCSHQEQAAAVASQLVRENDWSWNVIAICWLISSLHSVVLCQLQYLYLLCLLMVTCYYSQLTGTSCSQCNWIAFVTVCPCCSD